MDKMFTLNANVHRLVRSENGECVENEKGEWLITELGTDNVFFVTPTKELATFFNINIHNKDTVPHTVFTNPQEEPGRVTWTKVDIIKLINLYKKYQPSFKSTTIKNEKVWQSIALQLESHTAEQCKNKFKYLKSKYMEKRDNMGSKATGSKALKFDYFDEFQDIFGSDPNVEPLAVASSSRGEDNIPDKLPIGNEENHQPNQSQVNIKKRKRTLLEKQMTSYEEKLRERELNTERRHQESLQKQEDALEIFRRIASSFEKCVNKELHK